MQHALSSLNSWKVISCVTFIEKSDRKETLPEVCWDKLRDVCLTRKDGIYFSQKTYLGKGYKSLGEQYYSWGITCGLF